MTKHSRDHTSQSEITGKFKAPERNGFDLRSEPESESGSESDSGTDSEEIEELYEALQTRRKEIDRLQIQVISLQKKRINDLKERLDELMKGKEELGERTEVEKKGMQIATKREIEEAYEPEIEAEIEKYASHAPHLPCIVDDLPSECATPFVKTQHGETAAKNSWISWWYGILWRVERQSPTRETICTAIAMVFVAVNTSNSVPDPLTTTFLMNNILWALVLRYMLRKLVYAIRL